MKKVLVAMAGFGLALTSYANPATPDAQAQTQQGFLVHTDEQGQSTYYRVPMALNNEQDADKAIAQYARPEFVVDAPTGTAAIPTDVNAGTSDEAWHGRGGYYGRGYYGRGYYGGYYNPYYNPYYGPYYGPGYGPGYGYGWYGRGGGWGYYGRGHGHGFGHGGHGHHH